MADWTWQGGGDPRKWIHRNSLEAQGWSAGVTEQPGQERKVGAGKASTKGSTRTQKNRSWQSAWLVLTMRKVWFKIIVFVS